MPELALMELVARVSSKADFSQLDKLFDSAVNLRPALLQSLLSSCGQAKTYWFEHIVILDGIRFYGCLTFFPCKSDTL